jgi:hypothetical protein
VCVNVHGSNRNTTTICEAVQTANPGDTIVVGPGMYQVSSCRAGSPGGSSARAAHTGHPRWKDAVLWLTGTL